MGKSYKRLSADVKSADALAHAIMCLKHESRMSNPAKILGNVLSDFSNSAEIGRIVKYLVTDRVIVKDGKSFRWYGDVPTWDDPDKRRTYCLQMLKHSREDMPEVIVKPGKKPTPKVVKAAISSSPRQEDSPKSVLYRYGELDFTSHSDEELTAIAFAIQKELDARAEKREKLAKLHQVLELAEMSKDELIDLLGVV